MKVPYHTLPTPRKNKPSHANNVSAASSSESRLGVRGVRTRRLCFFVCLSRIDGVDDDTVKARETPRRAA